MSRIFFHLLFAVVVFALSNAALAEDVSKQRPACASHPVVYERSQPLISRVPLKVVDPVDVAVTRGGETYVADRVGQVIFRVDAWGDASLVASEITDLSRIARSAFGTFALRATPGSGEILQLTNNDARAATHLPFQPAGLAIHSDGSAYTTNSRTGELFRINLDGELQRVTQVSEPTLDVAINHLGSVHLLLRSGKVVTVYPDGETKDVAGYLPATSTRIAVDPNTGGVVGLATDAQEKSALYRVTGRRDETERFASVVRGTSAFAFDKLGNLTLASPDLRAITQVKSHFRIPCPACGELFPLVFSPNAPVRGHEESESF